MVKPRQFYNETVAQVVANRDAGLTQVEISERLSISQSAVSRSLKRYRETGSFGSKRRSGRPRKSTATSDRMIKRMVVGQPTISSSAIAAALPSTCSVSARTVRRRLVVDFNLKAHRPARKPHLSKKNKADRLAFARKYCKWTSEQWATVLFYDETSVQQFNRRQHYVRRPPGERTKARYVMPTVKHPQSTMVWGCFGAHGRGGLWFCPPKTTINGPIYLQLLQDKLQEWMARLHCQYFQHDGAPCHRSRAVTQWLHSANIQVIGPWPGNSPDLNPIENCWHIMKNKIAHHNSTSWNDMHENIKQVWCQEISVDYCRKLVESMPARLAAVIASNGGPTKY